jgi:hypothetical protein
MLVEYDFTLLVKGRPVRQSRDKRVLCAVSGSLDVAEEGPMVHFATADRRERKSERSVEQYWRAADGRCYVRMGDLRGGMFTDGDEGLPFLRKYRTVLVDTIRKLSLEERRRTLHPWLREPKWAATDRVDPDGPALKDVDSDAIRLERLKVEKALSGHVVCGGAVFALAPEPVLALSAAADANDGFVLSVEDDPASRLAHEPDFRPAAFFRLGDRVGARAHVNAFSGKAKPSIKGYGRKTEVHDGNWLLADIHGLTMLALGWRLLRNYLEIAEEWGVEALLTEVPPEQLTLVHRLALSLRASPTCLDEVEEAVRACLAYNGGRSAFTRKESGADSAEAMLHHWDNRPIGIDADGVA